LTEVKLRPSSRVSIRESTIRFRTHSTDQYRVVKADNTITDLAESERLFTLLDGLSLAIAHAGAYLQESGVGLGTYLKFYKQQWRELMESRNWDGSPLQDYPNRSVWTT
jgi:hypothetical protein